MNVPWLDNPLWPDIATLAYIGLFGLVCAVLILRETWMGWAMCIKNTAYALAFGYGAFMLARPDLANEDVRRSLRGAIAIAITWAIVQLLAVRFRRWRERRASV